jgi:hypothetical protein
MWRSCIGPTNKTWISWTTKLYNNNGNEVHYLLTYLLTYLQIYKSSQRWRRGVITCDVMARYGQTSFCHPASVSVRFAAGIVSPVFRRSIKRWSQFTNRARIATAIDTHLTHGFIFPTVNMLTNQPASGLVNNRWRQSHRRLYSMPSARIMTQTTKLPQCILSETHTWNISNQLPGLGRCENTRPGKRRYSGQ